MARNVGEFSGMGVRGVGTSLQDDAQKRYNVEGREIRDIGKRSTN